MRISREQIICGVPAIALRDAFKRLDSSWDIEYLAGLLKVPSEQAQECLSCLLGEGYVEPDSEVHGRQLFRVTLKGGALTLASALKPISRLKAESLVAEVVKRAREVNADPGQLYRVAKLTVFGSYLSDAEELGDVDIAVGLARKDDEWPPMPEGEYEYARRLPQGARKPRGPFETLAWPQEAVWRILKGKSRYISIHPASDQVLQSAKTMELLAPV